MELTKLEKTLDNIDKRLLNIELAVVGDDKLGIDGIVRRSESNEERIMAVEKKINKSYWMVAGAAGVLSFAVAAIIFVISKAEYFVTLFKGK